MFVCNARTVWIDLEESGNGRPIQSFSEGGGGDDASFLFFTMIPFHRKNSHFIKQVSFEFKSHVRRWSIIIQPKPWFSHNNANTVMLQELCRWTGTNLFIITLSSSPSHANFTDILSAKVFHKKAIFPFLFKIHWHWKLPTQNGKKLISVLIVNFRKFNKIIPIEPSPWNHVEVKPLWSYLHQNV